ncbi:hypothetical protein KXC42_16610 [Rhodococcus sp. LW-XY12]|nr:hypothetical protein KXC42_16610 [Rhodococcus sp. LW-XY12]
MVADQRDAGRGEFDTAPTDCGFAQRGEEEHASLRGVVNHELDERPHRGLGPAEGGGGQYRLGQRVAGAVGDVVVDLADEGVAVGEALVEVPFGEFGGPAHGPDVRCRAVGRSEQVDAHREEAFPAQPTAFVDADARPAAARGVHLVASRR